MGMNYPCRDGFARNMPGREQDLLNHDARNTRVIPLCRMFCTREISPARSFGWRGHRSMLMVSVAFVESNSRRTMGNPDGDNGF